MRRVSRVTSRNSLLIIMEKDGRKRLFFLHTCSYLNDMSEIVPPSLNQPEDRANTQKQNTVNRISKK